MSTKFDTRQSKQRGLLDQIADPAEFISNDGNNLDGLMESVNSELTPLVRLVSNDSLVVDVEASDIENPKSNFRRALPPVNGTQITFSSGTLTFPATSGGNIVASPGGNTVLTCPSGQFAAVMVSLDDNGDLITTVGSAQATEQDAVDNLPAIPTGQLGIGFVVVSNVGGTIQNITQSDIRQFPQPSQGDSASGSPFDVIEVNSHTNMVSGKTYLITPTGANINMTLPTPVAGAWVRLQIKGATPINRVTLVRNGSENIDGISFDQEYISEGDGFWGSVVLFSNGTDWFKE